MSDNCDGSRDGATRSGPDARHQGAANFAFMDGHVERATAAAMGYIPDSAGVLAYAGSAADNRRFSGNGRDEDPPPVN